MDTLVSGFLTIIKFIDKEVIGRLNNPFLSAVFGWVLKYRFEISLWCVGYIILHTFLLRRIKLERSKKKLICDILDRMSLELFDSDRHLHRITLFKEIRYPKAFIKNGVSFLYHLFLFPKKALLYILPPRVGRYLGIYARCGLQYRKSTTMLRVEENDPKKCNGVATYVRYREIALEAFDLPDISDITEDEFLKAKTSADIRKSRRRDVELYMQLGFISDFNLLKKVHRKARHFYGTVIQRKNHIWGVLLVDSIAPVNPLDDETVKKRFTSFATTISGIINMET